jgi:hypothetical protein
LAQKECYIQVIYLVYELHAYFSSFQNCGWAQECCADKFHTGASQREVNIAYIASISHSSSAQLGASHQVLSPATSSTFEDQFIQT